MDDASSPGQQPADALARYLREHYAAARGELDLVRRSARSQTEPEVRRRLSDLAARVAEDRAALLAVLVDLGIDPSPLKERLVAVAERLGRVKPNGSLLHRTRLSDLLELEAMVTAVQVRQLVWTSLRHLADSDHRLNPHQLDLLCRRAEEQRAQLEALRLECAGQVLAAVPTTSSDHAAARHDGEGA